MIVLKYRGILSLDCLGFHYKFGIWLTSVQNFGHILSFHMIQQMTNIIFVLIEQVLLYAFRIQQLVLKAAYSVTMNIFRNFLFSF